MNLRLALVATALLIVAGCGSGSSPSNSTLGNGSAGSENAPGTSAPGPGSTSDPVESESATEPGLPVSDCETLLKEGWRPPEEEPDISWTPGSGVAVISFTETRLVVNVMDDPACQRLPGVGQMIKTIVESRSRQER